MKIRIFASILFIYFTQLLTAQITFDAKGMNQIVYDSIVDNDIMLGNFDVEGMRDSKVFKRSFKNFPISWDKNVSICNKSGVLIKKKSFIGIKGLGELKSKKEIKKRVPEGLKKLFEEIFKDEEINHALNDTFIENTMDFQQKEEVAQSKADKLRELKKLLDEGILTQEEFESEKKKILDKANL